MATAKWTPLRGTIWLIMLVITPILYIAAFNYFFSTGIAYTVDNWLLAFLAGILVFMLLLVLIIIAMVGDAIAGPLGVILALVAIFALPVLFIFAFNLLLSVAVPYTVVSYILVGATMIGVWLLGAVVGKIR